MPPSPEPGRVPGAAAFVAVLVLSLALPTYWMLGPGSHPAPAEDAGRLAFADTAESHLLPVSAVDADVPDPDGGAARVQGDPFRFEGAPPRGAAAGGGPSAPDESGGGRWRVSTILTVGDERVAIVNDVSVREGDRLPDGAQVVSIDPGRVVLRSPAGDRIVLDF